MEATFNSNSSVKIISCHSPTNVSEETEHITFYDELSSLVRSILKHNVLVIEALTCFNSNFQKREGKLWTYTYENNTKAQTQEME